MAVSADLGRAAVQAYSATGDRWEAGPGRVYDRLAEVLVSRSPIPMSGLHVLDVGAGTGAGSRAALGAGAARVTAIDAAHGMLTVDARWRPPAVTADVRTIPLRDASADVALAAFSLNHLLDPVPAVVELCRVIGPTGAIVSGSYAADDTHPVKGAVEGALRAAGWQAPPWHEWMRVHATKAMATIEGVAAIASAAGLTDVTIDAIRVPFPDLTPDDLVSWRLGMAQHAPFVAALDARGRRRVRDEALRRLDGSTEHLVRSVIVLSAFGRPSSAQHRPDPASEAHGVGAR